MTIRPLLITVAAYVFLAGTVLVALSAVPALTRRWPKLMLVGFLLAVSSFALVGVAALFPVG